MTAPPAGLGGGWLCLALLASLNIRVLLSADGQDRPKRVYTLLVGFGRGVQRGGTGRGGVGRNWVQTAWHSGRESGWERGVADAGGRHGVGSSGGPGSAYEGS